LSVTVHNGDCRDVLAAMPEASVDAVVTDPPYGLSSGENAKTGFMGKEWDRGVPGVDVWAEVFRVLKPGAHVLAFGGTRTYHRLVCAIEDAGFEIRDQIGWAYGTGFPKSLNVSKAIDAASGAEREVVGPNPNGRPNMVRVNASVLSPRVDAPITASATPEAAAWEGWGTALKPAWEPIVVARKPLIGTVAANVMRFGTGALNIDATRVGTEGGTAKGTLPKGKSNGVYGDGLNGACEIKQLDAGRWPANLVHDGSDEVLGLFPGTPMTGFGDSGSAARFFYCAKASKAERGEGNTHMTVKPIALMRWLVRLVTPPGGCVLDPFAGSGTTGLAAMAEGFAATLIEAEAPYADIIASRLERAKATPVQETMDL
jgi:site-specific DNA-methyltransferase (adenine-specific)